MANSQRENVVGKQPPPPVPTAIAVTVSATTTTAARTSAALTPTSFVAVFTGVFFNNGLIHDDGVGVETSDGMAWLRFDNKQPDLGSYLTGAASANARFMVKGANPPTGSGTLTIGGVPYQIAQVFNFTRFESCGLVDGEVSPCAQILFSLTDPDGGTHAGNLVSFEESECIDTGEGGGLFYNCPFPETGGGC